MEVRTLFRATDRLYRTTDKTFHVVECGSCGLIRLHPWPEPWELGQYYPPAYWHQGKDTASRLEETYRRFVLRDHVGFVMGALEHSKETGLVLDVGCGGGLFLRALKEKGCQVAGLDFSPDAAAVAAGGNQVPAVCASLTRAPFPDGSCAAVTMFHVLEHVRDPASYLDAAHRLLKPDGRLIVQVPNAASWQFLLLGENWTGVDVPRHLINFRARDLELLLDQCGFEPVRSKYFSLRDNPAGLASSLAPCLDPMARRVRGMKEGTAATIVWNCLYLVLVFACLPFTLLEAACRAGSTVMIEARKKP